MRLKSSGSSRLAGTREVPRVTTNPLHPVLLARVVAILLLAIAAPACTSHSEPAGSAQPVSAPTTVLLPSATATSRPTATPMATATGAPYAAPALLAPLPAAEVYGPAVHLRWTWGEKLNENEWFELWVWPRGQGERTIRWSKSMQSDVTPPGGAGVHFWKVRVIRGTPGQPEPVALSPWSETRSFEWKGPQMAATATPALPHPSPTGA